MKELQVMATLENTEKVLNFIEEELDHIDCPVKAKMQLSVAVDEIFSNIARYAYQPEIGPATVRMEIKEEPLMVVLTFLDKGMPYNPLMREDPDVTEGLEEREIGGLGIFLVKKTMDAVEYEYKDEKNILTIKKYLGTDPGKKIF